MKLGRIVSIAVVGFGVWKGTDWYRKHTEMRELGQIAEAAGGQKSGEELQAIGNRMIELSQKNAPESEQEAVLKLACDKLSSMEDSLIRLSVGKPKPKAFRDNLKQDLSVAVGGCTDLLAGNDAGIKDFQQGMIQFVLHSMEMKNYAEMKLK